MESSCLLTVGLSNSPCTGAADPVGQASMREFRPRLIQVDGSESHLLEPVALDGRLSEKELEDFVVENPALAGEELLILGRQLHDFAEDQDRLDVLALDEDGEVVLLELKAAENFRVTDLQALAYAGAYADRPTEDLAETLRRGLERADAGSPLVTNTGLDPGASVDAVKDRIIEHVDFDSFDEWRPSKHVRIKLIAPQFPRRVLKTVKWLGDVYAMPIEAIQVRLYEDANTRYQLTFERLLPLPTEEEFDMTVRWTEDRQRSENVTRRRRPRVLPLLVDNGVLKEGDRLWLRKTALGPDKRDRYNPDEICFQAVVTINGLDTPKVTWQEAEDAEPEVIPPSLVTFRAYQVIAPGWDKEFTTAVGTSFTKGREGPTLEELALDHGLWSEESPEVPNGSNRSS